MKVKTINNLHKSGGRKGMQEPKFKFAHGGGKCTFKKNRFLHAPPRKLLMLVADASHKVAVNTANRKDMEEGLALHASAARVF